MSWTAIGATSALLALAAGAIGSHALPLGEGDAVRLFDLAARYQMYHALGLIAVGLVHQNRAAEVAGWCFLLGSVLFCGSLYARSLDWVERSPAPAGGLLLMAGWAALAWSQVGRRTARSQRVDEPGSDDR